MPSCGLVAYTSRQRRYTSESIDPQRIRAAIAAQWDYLDKMAAAFPAGEDE